jgi:hypothetical protein
MSELTIPGVSAHLICKGGIVLVTVALVVQTGGTSMPTAAVATTIDQGVARTVDASAASSATAMALIVTTLIASILITMTLITAALLVASILLALTLVALLVAARPLALILVALVLRTIIVWLGGSLVCDLSLEKVH